MYAKLNVLCVSVICAAFIGCGSGGSNPVDTINTLQEIDNIVDQIDEGLVEVANDLNKLPDMFDLNNTEFAGLAGVWNASDDFGVEVDELYLVIDANGLFRDYDYMGDTFDQGPNCYELESGWLEKSGDLYTLHYEDGQIITDISIEANGDVLSVVNSAEDFSADYPRETRTEEEFVPVCGAAIAPKPFAPRIWQ